MSKCMKGWRQGRVQSRCSVLAVSALSSVLASLIPVAAQGATLLPGQALQPAIDAAAPGEIIELAAGTYSGAILLRADVTLKGAGDGITVITGAIQVPSVASNVTLSDLTADSLTVTAPDFQLNRSSFNATVQFAGAATAQVTDTTFRGYLASDGSSSVTYSRIHTEQVGFARDTAQATFLDSTFDTYVELQGASNVRIARSILSGAYISGNADATLEDVQASGLLAVRGTGRADVRTSSLSSASLDEGGELRMADSDLNRLSLAIDTNIQATLTDVGPGSVTLGAGSSSNSTLELLLERTQIGDVSLDVRGQLLAHGGGLSGYSFVRDGANATFEDFTFGQYSIVEGSGRATLIDSLVEADLIFKGTSEGSFIGTLSTGGALTLEGSTHVEASAGTDLARVLLRGSGALELQDATLQKLILTVEAGKSAWIDGLQPGLGNGSVALPGPTGGPALELLGGDLRSIQLWIQGDGDVRNSRIDDYMVVEGTAYARLLNTRMDTFALFRGDALATASNCYSGAFLFAQNNALLTWDGGDVANFVEMKDNTVSTLRNTQLNATVETTGSALATFVGVQSTANTVKVRGNSRATFTQGATLYALQVLETGTATVADGHINTLTIDVAEGHDFQADGLKPGLLTAAFGPMTVGPTASLSTTQVDAVSLLNHGTAVLSNSALNGYTFAYPNASTHFTDTALKGVTYLLAGSQNALVGGSIENLFNVAGSTNRFEGVRFTATASAVIGGASHNTFSSCIFERGLTLSDSSVNDLGHINPGPDQSAGGNDFSLITGFFRLANNTPNTVYAQNNTWGSEDPTTLASLIIDQADDASFGPVLFDPFVRANRPPLVGAGDAVSISTLDQESTVLVGTASDPDLDGMSYRWLEGSLVLLDDTPVAGDGTAPLALSGVPFLGAGDHELTLEVTDSYGYIVTSSVIVTLGNSSPMVAANGGGVFAVGEAIVLEGELSDYDGDDIAYSWWMGDTLLFSGQVGTIVEGELVALPAHVLPSGLPVGDHVLTLEADDGVNASVRSTIAVQIADTLPPLLSPVASPSILWPPRGDMRPVVIDTYATDNAGKPVTLSVRVSSNEPKYQSWFGRADWTTPVINQTTGTISLDLRAEPNWNGQVREYVLWIEAKDQAGNSSRSQVSIRVAWRRGMWCDN